ncbi:MAG: helix-turn-helix transcriptional regulator [Cytophagales bacterium]|nr:helix-turn-helix transcriptional regulator [Cytophagales bacterium]
MGVTKTDLFTEKQNQMAVMAKAFGHPARIAIIEHLLKTNSCITNDFVSEFGLAQATISQHLKELKGLGIVKGNVEGTSMCYCIDSEVWSKVQENFESLFAKFDCERSC